MRKVFYQDKLECFNVSQEIFRILVINPGSTSTKIAVFDNEKMIFEESLSHSAEDLAEFPKVIDQFNFRKKVILETLSKNEINITKLNAVVGRGGLLRPIPGGTYLVDENMLNDLRTARFGEHASNLGALIAYEIAKNLNISAFIVDPVVVDEMQPLARISGIPTVERKSIFHALNQKAVARRAAKDLNKKYDEVNFVVCHMGGGITVGAHRKGKVVDVNNGLYGEGPFSPERAGTIPIGDLIALSFSGKYFAGEILKMLVGQGGLVGYLGTNDARKVEEMINANNDYAKLIYDAMAYQIAKEIGAYSTVLQGEIDAIILTGGLAYSEMLTDKINSFISWIAPVKIYPGENELQALAEGALRVLFKEEEAKIYPME